MVINIIHVNEIAMKHLGKWESLSPYLGLDHTTEESIRSTSKGDYEMQKRKFLQEWIRVKGNQATYDELITAAERASDQNLADSVKKMMKATVPYTSQRYVFVCL